MYPVKKQHRNISQQAEKFDVNAMQKSINHCACILCIRKSMESFQQNQHWQMRNRVQIADKSLMHQKQQNSKYGQKQQKTTWLAKQTQEVISHYNQNSMQARTVNFKPSTVAVKASSVVNKRRGFYQQNVNCHPNFISKEYFDTHKIQNATQTYAQTKNSFYNQFFSNFYHKTNFDNHLPYFPRSSGSLSSSIRSSDSETNNLMTSQQVRQ